MAKRFDPKAKARRQKIIAAALGVVLLGVLVFQAPTILGAFGGDSSSTPASEPAPAPTAPGSVPVATPAPVAGPAAALVDTDPAPVPEAGQLVSFDRFESKDPFAPQIGDSSGGGSGGGEKAPVPADPNKKADHPEGVAPAPAGEPAPQPSDGGGVKTATISVNGVDEDVAVKANFPAADPIFKLVYLTKSSAKVGIVGGSYANGTPTVTLTKGGKPVTLMNTADGTTYVLRLVAVA